VPNLFYEAEMIIQVGVDCWAWFKGRKWRCVTRFTGGCSMWWSQVSL